MGLWEEPIDTISVQTTKNKLTLGTNVEVFETI